MSRIAIINPCIVSGDAVCNDVLYMYNVLHEQNMDVCIFADDWDRNLNNFNIKHIGKLDAYIRNKNDLIIYHHSVGWEKGIEILRKKKCKRMRLRLRISGCSHALRV